MSKLKHLKKVLLCALLIIAPFLLSACQVVQIGEGSQVFSVNVQQSTGGFVLIDKSLAVPGETITITVLPDSGYKLKLVAYNAMLIENNTFTMPAQNVTVTARFVQVYKLTILSSEHGTITLSTQEAAYGEFVQVNASPEEGYRLSKILVNGEAINETNFSMPSNDSTVTAQFELI